MRPLIPGADLIYAAIFCQLKYYGPTSEHGASGALVTQKSSPSTPAFDQKYSCQSARLDIENCPSQDSITQNIAEVNARAWNPATPVMAAGERQSRSRILRRPAVSSVEHGLSLISKVRARKRVVEGSIESQLSRKEGVAGGACTSLRRRTSLAVLEARRGSRTPGDTGGKWSLWAAEEQEEEGRTSDRLGLTLVTTWDIGSIAARGDCAGNALLLLPRTWTRRSAWSAHRLLLCERSQAMSIPKTMLHPALQPG
ncbi:hypothetical protein DFH06DRAFT_690792 [Mycena polygramma]|nr:hypothetical protein DFH06DRAFT_690792 [Mycena polygramma]